ncbi:hypothetical protein KJ359_009001 [Pestalotiopsis sp. 9143b]|nr:hypothetical protein KJ359_009001 [Pestalotiopsis sp. 9143b]
MKTHLEGLPAELLRIILSTLQSPLELRCTIQASSACYRTFLGSKASILTQVLHNALGQATPEALGALYALDIPNSQKVSKAEHRRIVLDFLQKLQNSRLQFPHRFEDVARLSRLWLRVDAFVTDYSSRAHMLLHSKEPPALPAWAHPSSPMLRTSIALSPTESTRMQRAFFRFDIYRSCFQPEWEDSDGRSPIFSASEQCRLFLRALPEWEVEELCCVHQYLTSLLVVLVGHLEDAFYGEVQHAAKPPGNASTSAPESPSVKGSTANSTDDGLADPLNGRAPAPFPVLEQSDTREPNNMELDGLFLFSEAQKIQFEMYMSSLSTEGTQFIRNLLCADEDERRLQITGASQSSGRVSLRLALRQLDMRNHEIPTDPVTVDNESALHYNHGWFRTGGTVGSSWLRVDSRFSLRDAGYVFWDVSRFVGFGWENRKYTYDERQTVEERLRGVKVDKKLYKAIVLRYTPDYLD